MGTPIDRTAKTALDSNLVNGVTSDAPKVKANNDVLYNYSDTLNSAQDAHAAATTLPHADGSVTGPKLRDGAVTTAKIADLAVTSAKIANGAVGVNQLATGLAVTADVNAMFAKRGIDVTSAPYNAVGDGVTDDTAAIQAAVTAGNGTRTVLFPPGTYKISSAITMVAGQNIQGLNATILGTSTITIFTAANDAYFEGITFQNCDTAINATGKNNVSAHRCIFDTIATVGIYYYGTQRGSVTNCYFNNITKSSIIIDNDGSDIKIINNTFTNPTEFGGYGTSQTSAHVNCLNGIGIEVIGNTVKNNGGQGIIFGYNSTSAKGSYRCKAIGNHCEGNGQEGLTSYGGNSKLAHSNAFIGNTSRNNRFNQIEIWQSDYCVVIGCIAEETATTYGSTSAIMVHESEHFVVDGCNVRQATSNGIAVELTSKKGTISNCNIMNTNTINSATATVGQGILLNSNGGAHPTNVMIFNITVESTNGFTAAKAGVYSATNVNKDHQIEFVQSIGYQTPIAYFALLCTWNHSDTLPTVSRFQGDFVKKISTVEAGTTPNKYIITGWVNVADGVNWKESRVLTGN